MWPTGNFLSFFSFQKTSRICYSVSPRIRLGRRDNGKLLAQLLMHLKVWLPCGVLTQHWFKPALKTDATGKPYFKTLKISLGLSAVNHINISHMI